MTIWIFFLDDEDNLIKVPLKRYRELRQGKGLPYPQFAEKTVKTLQVLLKLEDRRPVEIIKIYYPLHEFDADGKMNAEHIEDNLRGALSTRENEFAVIEYQRRHQWNPKDFEAEIIEQKINKIIFNGN